MADRAGRPDDISASAAAEPDNSAVRGPPGDGSGVVAGVRLYGVGADRFGAGNPPESLVSKVS